ncbi:Basic-leucine zipper (bZIP) transcription factor family protein [Raphanus sativus]|uniref:BZIP transcription factor 29 n=1 Tax=Raphanus sativus TaxID=3726 RepID=A0A6J0LWR3_RAPSA|nr:bZIP transcription factor 29 [Raphanus sativus]KAJ4880064.1 Basic-leucine zipper (bZIP) transcription factor family protein [Raphanus sativus]
MGDTDSDMIRTSIPKQPHQLELNPNHIQFSSDSTRRVGVPPTSPYSQIPTTRPQQPQGGAHSRSRSMSQPSSFFSFDSLPPLSPSPFSFNNNTSSPLLLPPSSPFTRCNSDSSSSSRVVLPPRKSHRRSNSDIHIPTCFNSPIPPFVKREDMDDDLFSAYMNLENIDALNSSEADDDNNDNSKNGESSRASGTTKTSDDTEEGESSSVNYESDRNNTLKRRADGGGGGGGGGGDVAPTTRHYRSVSVDSCFMEKLSFGEEVSPTNSVSIEFKKGEFTAAEMKKIMANDKLAEMAMSDPKRVKRILANRQSAARSKERKMRYIVELEHKVQTLQTEATTLSAQFTLLQRDMMVLTNQNNELKFRLQAMEQQAQLRDALNEALSGEVQRLKLAIGETSHNEADRSKMQSLNADMFQQLNISQLTQQPQPQSQQNQNGTMSPKPESNEL